MLYGVAFFDMERLLPNTALQYPKIFALRVREKEWLTLCNLVIFSASNIVKNIIVFTV